MKPRTTSKRKPISPVVSIVVILVVLALIGVVGYIYFKPKPGVGPGAPTMSAEVKKQRQSQSAIWAEELKKAKREHRLPNYDLLPRAGHPGAPSGPGGGGPGPAAPIGN